MRNERQKSVRGLQATMEMVSVRQGAVYAVVAIGAALLMGSVQATGLSDVYGSCLDKFANHKQAVTVMLFCNANSGKLKSCQVIDAPVPPNGFDKAALCVADALPVGSKTGPTKVPISFSSN